MGFFTKKKDPETVVIHEEYNRQRKAELHEIEERWYIFLNKLEQRYLELIEMGKEEGKKLFEDNSDPFKGAYHRFRSGWSGQLKNIVEKARQTEDEQIIRCYVPAHFREKSELMIRLNDEMEEWYSQCRDYFYEWEQRIQNLEEEAVKYMEEEDLELKYKEIIDDYNAVKDRFHCNQCGARISIDEFYSMPVYITCPHCQTQNTFKPSTKMSMLDLIARPLAEQRCQALKREYEANYRYADDSPVTQAKRLNDFEYYERYIRALFNEMNKILPFMKEQNEKFYQRMINDYKREVL